MSQGTFLPGVNSDYIYMQTALHGSAPDSQGLNDSGVPLGASRFEVAKHFLPLCHHADESTLGGNILLVGLQMLGQISDTFGKDGNLNFRRAGVTFSGGVLADNFGLAFFADGHATSRLFVVKS
jgi:hypothetical protein